MIDTIRLVLDIDKIPENFKLIRRRDNVLCATMNPTKEMKASGKYYPKLSYVERPTKTSSTRQLYVEFSIPKLLLDNNFCEVEEADFDAIIVSSADFRNGGKSCITILARVTSCFMTKSLA